MKTLEALTNEDLTGSKKGLVVEEVRTDKDTIGGE